MEVCLVVLFDGWRGQEPRGVNGVHSAHEPPWSILVLVEMIPQSAGQLSCYDVACILGDHPQDEASVASQIPGHKLLHFLFVVSHRSAAELADGVQVSADELCLSLDADGVDEPDDETANGDEPDEHEPEPEEYEEDLVEQVHGKSTLDRVAVNVTDATYFHLTNHHP